MKVLVTGSEGFIGKNLCLWLSNAGHKVLGYDLGSTEEDLKAYVKEADWIVHLAGVNRPLKEEEFLDGNVNLTKRLADIVAETGSKAPIIFSSSTKAEKDDPYGRSKKMAEDFLFAFSEESSHPVYVYRLYNVFGKWCRPNYNSVIATWCYDISRGIPIEINKAAPKIDFVYVDDVCREFLSVIDGKQKPSLGSINHVEPHYSESLQDIADALYSFRDSRKTLNVPSLAPGFFKDLYSTYLSYLPAESLSYPLTMHADRRGSFTEILKTMDHGQISVNIAHPGITKGNHYHQSKNEKYVVVSGKCEIRLRKVGTDEIVSYVCSGDELKAVDIPPGYAHSITTLGDEDSVTLMWANEPFDPENPDTYPEEV
jgi:UDP-2-acetamido-2,6-beta-L-arabino-hexul-4-ose reductase